MPTISRSHLPQPKDWDEFEEMCADFFGAEWGDLSATRYGRQGQRQHGVDIYGKPSGGGYAGVQCKGRRRWPPRPLTTEEVDEEVAKALNFRPPLAELTFATIAADDVHIQDHARLITERHAAHGLFSVHVVGWDELVRRFTKHSKFLEKHYGYVNNSLILDEVRKTPEETARLVAEQLLPSRNADGELPHVGLHSVPPVPPGFKGRNQEQAELLRRVREGGSGVLAIRGLPGVGKTTLAFKLAAELQADYPDAQLYLDLKGDSSRPRSRKEIMAIIVRSFDSKKQVPESEEIQHGLYLDQLHGKRVLLLMDNAADTQQISRLIGPRGSLVLVTTRFELALPGEASFELKELSPPEAVELLTEAASRLKGAAASELSELARMCGYLPLALRAVAGALQSRKRLSVADYLRRLEETGRRLLLKEEDWLQRSTAAALQSSYELLRSESQTRFRMLGVFPGTFDLAAAASVWGTDLEHARDLLDEIDQYGLLSLSAARNVLHDLVRVFAGQLMSGEERGAASQRHASHYLKVLLEAKQLYANDGSSRARAMELLTDEWLNIQAGQRWSADHVRDDEQAAKWCWQFADGADSLAAHLYGQERIRWFQDALTAAEKLGDLAWQAQGHIRDRDGVTVNEIARALSALGWAYRGCGQYRPAVECHTKHLQMAMTHQNPNWECEAVFALALAHESLGEYDRAIELLERRVQLAIKLVRKGDEATAYGCLGNIYNDCGQYALARDYHTKRLEMQRRLGRPAGHALWGLGRALHGLGDNGAAKKCLEESLRISRDLVDIVAEHTALGFLGDVYHSEKDYGRARDYHTGRAEMARKIGDRLGEAQGFAGSARAMYELAQSPDEFGLAIKRLEAALQILEAIESPEALKVREDLRRWTAAGTPRA